VWGAHSTPSVRQLIFNPPEIVQTRTVAGSLGGPHRGCGCSRLKGDVDVCCATLRGIGQEVVVPRCPVSRKERASFTGRVFSLNSGWACVVEHSLGLHIWPAAMDVIGGREFMKRSEDMYKSGSLICYETFCDTHLDGMTSLKDWHDNSSRSAFMWHIPISVRVVRTIENNDQRDIYNSHVARTLGIPDDEPQRSCAQRGQQMGL
jgi:hypothetical protein